MRGMLLLCCMALALAGCRQSAGESLAEAALEKATGHKVDVDEDGGSVTIKTDEGEMKIHGGDNATLPANFPKDVYLPAGYAVESVMEVNRTQLIALKAPGEVARLYADARAAMEKQGWKQTMAMQGSASDGLLAYEKDGRKATVSFNGEGAGEPIAVGLQVMEAEPDTAAQ